MRRISRMPAADRPREKMIRKGVECLTDTELIAVLLGSGTRNQHVMKLAAGVRRKLESSEGVPALAELRQIEGLGLAKSCQIAAACEIARRRGPANRAKIADPESVLPLISFIAGKPQEYLVCVSLNGAGEVLGTRVVTIGLLNSTNIHPREVFADPIADRAANVILAHNHPSGSPNPSRRDVRVNERLVEAGDILGIPIDEDPFSPPIFPATSLWFCESS